MIDYRWFLLRLFLVVAVVVVVEEEKKKYESQYLKNDVDCICV